MASAWLSLAVFPGGAEAVTLPAGFGEDVAFSGLTYPTAVEFAPDGRVFVAEKSGLIKVFSGLDDTTPEVVADLRTEVYNFWDRGLLDIALDPDFTNHPYLYALYTHDAEIGGTAPRWGSPGVSSDPCPSPPGPTDDGCVVSGRLSRLPLTGNTAGEEQVLVEDWCQQYPSHSIGAIAFDKDGALLASAGEGASFTFTDYGQKGDPTNPCGDPPSGVGGTQSAPTAEGGSLRAQDLQTSGDPVGLDGSVIRVDRSDGSPLPDNPNSAMADPNARRIVAEGLRNPFRIAVRPGTDEVWIGDVGASAYEEIDRLTLSAGSENFGWPCWEASNRNGAFDGADLDICEGLYASPGSTTAPFFAYPHSGKVVAGESCPTGSSSISGLAFYEGGPFPDAYDGALLFADYSRNCIWAMQPGTDGKPDPSQLVTLADGASYPVNLVVGGDGALYYPDFDGGSIRAIRYFDSNQPPTAAISADPSFGDAPLTVQFDGSASADPDSAGPLTYAWDLDGDGNFDDSTEVAPSRTYDVGGTYLVKVRVTDPDGASDTAQTSIQVDNSPPTASIDAPGPGLKWTAGEEISFAGSADDPEQGALGDAALDWELILHHCPSNCHAHPLQQWEGVSGGSFSAPDHEYPSHLELKLTATDAGGLSDSTSVELDPRTTRITLRSRPAGATLTLGGDSAVAPLTREVIVGSLNSISAPAEFDSGGQTYAWESWSQGGSRQQAVTAPSGDTTYEAIYRDVTPPETTIDQGPPDRAGDTAATFRFSSSEPGSSFRCRVDGAAFSPCTSPYTTDELGDGEHAFAVQAIDAAGNPDASPASRRWRIATAMSAWLGRVPRLGEPIRLWISCEAFCRAHAHGRIVTTGWHGAMRRHRSRRVVRLRRRSLRLERGGRARLKLRPKRRVDRRRLRRAIRRGAVGRARLRVKLVDARGTASTANPRARLRPAR